MHLSGLQAALITAGAMGVACAVLSVFVVLRRWAFIGEGIAHAGFGGAGTAWMLSLLLPAVPFFRSSAGIYLIAIAFCLCVAVGIATVTRRTGVHADTAIGIFLVAALAWGFIAYRIYTQQRGVEPAGWGEYLFGQMMILDDRYVWSAVALCAMVVAVVALLGKEIIFYSFDPTLAEVSGVRVGFIHYLLIVLLTVLIVLGMRLIGSVLITALLLLPGATALMISRRLALVMTISVFVGLSGAAVGTLAAAQWRYIPEGPAIVLALVAEFVAVYGWRRIVTRSS